MPGSQAAQSAPGTTVIILNIIYNYEDSSSLSRHGPLLSPSESPELPHFPLTFLIGIVYCCVQPQLLWPFAIIAFCPPLVAISGAAGCVNWLPLTTTATSCIQKPDTRKGKCPSKLVPYKHAYKLNASSTETLFKHL